jgi:hypothetical protein
MSTKRKQRTNFYVDPERHDALRDVASIEETTVSDLVREGIDRVIAARLNNPKPDRAVLRDQFKIFLERHAASIPTTSDDTEVSDVDLQDSKHVRT